MMRLTLSNSLGAVRPSPTIAMTFKAAELKASGKDVIGLGAGEPDFDTPDFVKEAAIKAIKEGKTKYTPVGGILPLKKAVADKFLRENGAVYQPSEIIVGVGAKQVLYNALAATMNAGDEAVIPAPYWVSYPDMTLLAGGTPVCVECPEEEGFKLTPARLAAALTPKTKWVFLNSPSNPTGAGYTAEELGALVDVVEQQSNAFIISDDIYEHVRYDGFAFATAAGVRPGMRDRILTVNGVSKAYAMTGWRIGYAAGPKYLIDAMEMIQSQSTSNPCSVSQYAALAALEGGAAAEEFILKGQEIFVRRRDATLAAINAIPGLSCRKPEGAFYLFVNCKAFAGATAQDGNVLRNDSDFVNYLLEEALVAGVPGSAFGLEGYFRISYAAADALLEEACKRIARACGALKRA